MQKKTIQICIAFLSILSIQKADAQSLVEISVGTSTMDRYFTVLAYRQQINDIFRVGFEIQ